jgi:tetratricopeptide (TPR) repeat protein
MIASSRRSSAQQVFVCLGICALATVPTSSIASAAALNENSVGTWLARASVQRGAADRDAEIRSLTRVLELDGTHPATHARLSELSGPAPRHALTNSEQKIHRAMDHPYDPEALLRGGQALAQQGRVDESIELLERAVWLADLDPSSALEALMALRELSPQWHGRRVVPVQVYADDKLRSGAGWRFALRTAWLSASNSLDEVLKTRFVPIAITAFDPGDRSNDLDAMYRRFVEKVPPPVEGIAAWMTGRPVPSLPGVWKKGVAELLGRSMAVRIEPGASQSRVLSHELLHLYGAIHVLDDVESLMNPAGTSFKLDAGSFRITQAMAHRSFGAGGIQRNVLPFVDLKRVTDAYLDALSANLAFRDMGITEARQVETSRDAAARRVQRATSLDSHFGDAARVAGGLMIADSRRAEALRLLEIAAQLYPINSAKGLKVAREADALRLDLARSNPPVADRGL